jgi:hypothetical protein
VFPGTEVDRKVTKIGLRGRRHGALDVSVEPLMGIWNSDYVANRLNL